MTKERFTFITLTAINSNKNTQCVRVRFFYNFRLVLISIVKLLNVEALIPGGGGGGRFCLNLNSGFFVFLNFTDFCIFLPQYYLFFSPQSVLSSYILRLNGDHIFFCAFFTGNVQACEDATLLV